MIFPVIGTAFKHVETCEPWCAGATAAVEIGVMMLPGGTEAKGEAVGDGFKRGIDASVDGAGRMLLELKQQFNLIYPDTDLKTYKKDGRRVALYSTSPAHGASRLPVPPAWARWSVPIRDIALAVCTGKKPSAVYTAPCRRELPFVMDGGYCRVVVPEVRAHEMVVFEGV